MDGGQGAIMAGVHGLEHIKGFLAAHLPHDDSVGPHSQAVDDQVPLGNHSLAFNVCGPGLEPHHVPLLELQLRRVFDGDNALLAGINRERTFRTVVFPLPVRRRSKC